MHTHTVNPIIKVHFSFPEEVSLYDRTWCPIITGSLAWGRWDTKRPLIRVPLEHRLFTIYIHTNTHMQALYVYMFLYIFIFVHMYGIGYMYIICTHFSDLWICSSLWESDRFFLSMRKVCAVLSDSSDSTSIFLILKQSIREIYYYLNNFLSIYI